MFVLRAESAGNPRLNCTALVQFSQFRVAKSMPYNGVHAIGRVAQLVRAPASHAGGPGFESLRAHHLSARQPATVLPRGIVGT